MSTATLETTFQVWTDYGEGGPNVGLEVRPDPDVGEWVEILTHPDQVSKGYYGEIQFSINQDTALALAKALLRCVKAIKESPSSSLEEK